MALNSKTNKSTEANPPQETMRTAHLGHIVAFKPEERDEDECEIEAVDYHLPDEPAKLVELLHETDREETVKLADLKAKNSKLRAIREKFHDVQQVKTPARMKPEDIASLLAGQSAPANESRLAAVAREHPLVGESLAELWDQDKSRRTQINRPS